MNKQEAFRLALTHYNWSYSTCLIENEEVAYMWAKVYCQAELTDIEEAVEKGSLVETEEPLLTIVNELYYDRLGYGYI